MPISECLRLIAALLVALCAPACMRARMAGLGVIQLHSVLRILLRWKARGRRLRQPGEDLETVRRRIDRIVWIARNPMRALRHMARCLRGLLRARNLMVVPGAWTPPASPPSQAFVAVVAPAGADSS